MKAKFYKGAVTFYREEGDPHFHGIKHAKGEHALLHFIKKWLNARGFDLIKKRAQQDGHMLGDQYQPYLRCRHKNSNSPHIMLYSGNYALRGANEDWNNGEVRLLMQDNCFDNGNMTWQRIKALAKEFKFSTSK